MIGGTNAYKSQSAWRQVYRSLEHGAAKNGCKNGIMIKKFPKGIEDFANVFVQMQEKRHRADYDPFASFTKSEVIQDIDTVELAISDFQAEAIKDRRAFCAYLLLKPRTV